MAFKRTTDSPSKPAPLPYWRFNPDAGSHRSILRSEHPQSNALTDAVLSLVHRVRCEHLSPAEAVVWLAQSPSFVTDRFAHVAADWCRGEALQDWPTRQSDSSITAFVKHWGFPVDDLPWAELHRDLWHDACRIDRGKRGLPEPVVGNFDALLATLVRGFAMPHRRTLADLALSDTHVPEELRR